MNAPKFKKGDWIKRKKDGRIGRVVMLLETCYSISLTDGDCWWLDYDCQDKWELTDVPLKNKLEETAEEWAENEAYGKSDAEFEMAYKGFIAGVEWQKGQMMKDAMEGEIVKDIYNNKLALTAKNINLDGFKFGDKVKMIIVKNEE